MVEREVVLPAGRDEVWDALLDGGWLGDEVELEPWPGGEVVVDERRGVVEEVDEGERLVLRWARPGEDETRVELVLADALTRTGVATRLVVVETAPVRGPLLVAA